MNDVQFTLFDKQEGVFPSLALPVYNVNQTDRVLTVNDLNTS